MEINKIAQIKISKQMENTDAFKLAFSFSKLIRHKLEEIGRTHSHSVEKKLYDITQLFTLHRPERKMRQDYPTKIF